MAEILERAARTFVDDALAKATWEEIEQYFIELLDRKLDSKEKLHQWLLDSSELEACLEEDAAWRYIKMTIDTTDEQKAKDYQAFITEIQPKIAPYSDKLNKKLLDCPHTSELKGEAYEIYLKKIRKATEIFREKNIPLISELQQKSQEYGQITGQMKVTIDGKDLTMPKAAAELQNTDRNYREKVYTEISKVRLASADKLDDLFSDLVKGRHEVARNAGFENYRDYMFVALSRFDYGVQDCFDFHESIKKHIAPLAEEIALSRKERMGVDRLRPWDMSVDPEGKEPLKPFDKAETLVRGSISIFNKVDPYFGNCLDIMREMKYLDLESKEGKAPGGYNYPLYEIGVPFIFMNAVGTPRDLVTMMHEGGHAVHSFLSRDLELTSFKSCPSEVAELASMAMELLSMEHWNEFYTSEDEFIRAKKEHLEDILSMLPWIAIIDRYQHWIYENPDHSKEERKTEWLNIQADLGLKSLDWSGHEEALEYSWQKQLHLFEVPFYYIEYGMAQLGALAVWRNYKQLGKKAVDQYKEALKLGYTKSIGEIYKRAGIAFDFSAEYIGELAQFTKDELNKLS